MRPPARSLRYSAVPVGVALGALAWLIPVAVGGPAYRDLAYEAAGVLITQLIWFVWSMPLAVFSTSVARTRGALGPMWTVLQAVLVLDVAARAAPPLLVALPPVVGVLTSSPALLIIPVLALLVSALQGIVLFLRA